jgi:hypothetical protein
MAEFNELIDKLADRAQKAAEHVHASTSDTKEKLELQVSKARAAADKTTQEHEAKAADSQDEATRHWGEIRQQWRHHTAEIQARVDAEKDKLDVTRAKDRAAYAEGDALEAIDFAYTAIEWAEWAIVDAQLARLKADELAATRV